MQEDLGWDTQKKRCLGSRLCMIYKIDHKLVDVKKKEKCLHSGDSRTYGGHKFYQKQTTSEIYRNSFFTRTVINWNKLPSTVTAVESLEALGVFKNFMNSFSLFRESFVECLQGKAIDQAWSEFKDAIHEGLRKLFPLSSLVLRNTFLG